MKPSKLTLTITIAGVLATTGIAQQNQNDPQKNPDQRNKNQPQYQQGDQKPDQTRIIGKTTTSSIALGQPFLAIQASDLIGKDIENSQGKDIGEVNDLLIDMSQGRVAGVVVGVGGVLGIGEKDRVVPPQAISCQGKDHADYTANDRSKTENDRVTDGARQADKDSVLVLNMEEKLRTSKTTSEDLTSYQHLDQVYRDFQQTPYWKSDAENRQPVRQQDQDTTGGKVTSFQVKKANELMGKEIKNSADNDLGEMQDFVVDLQSGRVVYAIVSAGGTLGIGDNLIAVPPRQFAMNSDGSLRLNTTEEKLKNAPRFRDNQRANLSDPTWVSKVYGYYGETEYWTADPTKVKDDQLNDSLNRIQERNREKNNDDQR